jgi:hypothetical protein
LLTGPRRPRAAPPSPAVPVGFSPTEACWVRTHRCSAVRDGDRVLDAVLDGSRRAKLRPQKDRAPGVDPPRGLEWRWMSR